MEEILQRLQALEETVRRLQEQRGSTRPILREIRRCPACQCEEILFTDRLEVSRALASSEVLRVASTVGWTVKPRGILQAYICARCGYGELQLDDPAAIADEPHVKKLSPLKTEGDPYR